VAFLKKPVCIHHSVYSYFGDKFWDKFWDKFLSSLNITDQAQDYED